MSAMTAPVPSAPVPAATPARGTVSPARRLFDVVRLHLLDRWSLTALPWVVLAFAFGVNMAIFALIPASARPEQNYTGSVSAIYVIMTVVGALAISKFLPFALDLGLTRRTYYLGTVLTVVLAAIVNGALLTAFNVIEGATNGWGIRLNMFRVPGILDGPAQEVFAVSAVLLALFYMVGLWGGLAFARWKMWGLLGLIFAVVLVLLGAVWIITATHSWPSVGHFLTHTSIYGLMGIAAGVAALMALGGYATIRRVRY